MRIGTSFRKCYDDDNHENMDNGYRCDGCDGLGGSISNGDGSDGQI